MHLLIMWNLAEAKLRKMNDEPYSASHAERQRDCLQGLSAANKSGGSVEAYLQEAPSPSSKMGKGGKRGASTGGSNGGPSTRGSNGGRPRGAAMGGGHGG